MQSAPDRMSFGHSFHLGTDLYNATCDECHANTVPNDCTTAILSPGGYAYHVNGNKRDIRGSTSVKQSPVVNDAYVYDNNHDCSNNYCHSNGRSQTPPFTRRTPSFRFTWDNALSPGCTSSNVCHPSSNSFADQTFPTDGDNSAHTKHHYTCGGCHTTTIGDPYGSGLHVNGVKDVTMINSYDNDLIPNNNYNLPTKTCSGLACHGGNSVSWTALPAAVISSNTTIKPTLTMDCAQRKHRNRPFCSAINTSGIPECTRCSSPVM
jgi:predicted CxxxxCH...CXXCH cytochrome family protein